MMGRIYQELLRRNVLRVGAAYLVAAWLIIQVTETVFPLFGFSETPARIVVILLAIGLLPALVFAWVFEWTPEGLKKERDVAPAQSITRETGQRLDRAIIMVLALALAYFAIDRFVLEPQRTASLEARQAEQLAAAHEAGRSEALVESYGDQSIAVLPFADLSPQGNHDYLSTGIAEELLNLLAQIPELRVISRTSAFSFAGQAVPIPAIAQQLNVRHILEGSVRTSGNRIRVTAQLIEAHSDTHLWSQTYDREVGDLFAIQDDIAAAIVEQLKLALIEPLAKRTEIDPEVYDLYLRARESFRARNAEGDARALELLQRALVLDSGYAPIWSLLGQVYMGDQYHRSMPFEESVPLVRSAAERALSLDPSDWNAHLLKIAIARDVDRDLQATARYLETFMASAQGDARIYELAAWMSKILGRPAEAVDLMEYAIERDPLVPWFYVQLGINQYYSQRVEDAKRSFQRALELEPRIMQAHSFMAVMLILEGHYEEALLEAEQEPWPASRFAGTSAAYYSMGEKARSDAALAELLQLPNTAVGYGVLAIYAWRGEIESALDWLEQNADQVLFPILAETQVAPLLEEVHRQPRYRALMHQYGISREQLAAIEFSVVLPD